MPIDHATTIEAEAALLVAAYTADSGGRVPWSDRWTVGTVARHVAGTHHVVTQVLEGRPTADFGLFAGLEAPSKEDSGFPAWFAAGTASLCAALRAIDPEDACWSWYPDGRTVGWWGRRMAHETLVHRWDAEVGAGLMPTAVDPSLAADGVDEYLDVFVSTTRGLNDAPAGPVVGIECTDLDRRWVLDLSSPGGSTLSQGEHATTCTTTLQGPAEGLWLLLWGRIDLDTAGVKLDGDARLLTDRAVLLTSM
jgi:uncharacterized protein (TIGR03083 family)